jgi:hypothetical protein
MCLELKFCVHIPNLFTCQVSKGGIWLATNSHLAYAVAACGLWHQPSAACHSFDTHKGYHRRVVQFGHLTLGKCVVDESPATLVAWCGLRLETNTPNFFQNLYMGFLKEVA